jgi:hypothetical protein
MRNMRTSQRRLDPVNTAVRRRGEGQLFFSFFSEELWLREGNASSGAVSAL